MTTKYTKNSKSCCNMLPEPKKQKKKFCCPFIEKLLTNNALFNTIEIVPRAVVFKYASKSVLYKETIKITNKFDEMRTFEVNWSKSIESIDMKILGTTALMPEESFIIEVYLEPTCKSQIEDKRINIYLATEHPSLILEIPVIIVGKSYEVSCLTSIKMPKVTPNVVSHYAMVIYNPFEKTINAKFDTQYVGPKLTEALILSCYNVKIKPFDFFILYLKGFAPNYCTLCSELYIRFNNRVTVAVIVERKMVIYYPFFNHYSLQFGTVLLGCEQHRTIRICNESNDPLQVKWCRKDNISLSQKDSENTIQTVDPDTKKLTDYLMVKPKKSYIAAKSSVFCTFTFAPNPENSDIGVDESDEPPILLRCSAYLATTTDRDVRIELKFCGYLKGPEIYLNVKSIDLGEINLGENQCLEVIATNIDILPGAISFYRLQSCIKAKCLVIPKEISLNPGQSDVFRIQYFTNDAGKFIDSLVFKVKFGTFCKVILKTCGNPSYEIILTNKMSMEHGMDLIKRDSLFSGQSNPFQIQMEPSEVDFGSVPICIVNKQTVVLTNPLTVPIMIFTQICNDGTDQPLILDVVDKLPPINISREWDSNDSCKSLSEYSFWIYESKCRACCDSFYGDNIDNLVHECTDWHSSNYDSSESIPSGKEDDKAFKKLVLDQVPCYAENLLKYIENKKMHENPEAEVKIIQKVVDYLVAMPFFQILKQKNFYKKANWDCIVSFPKEIVVERFNYFLKPSESVEFRFLMIPNTVGKCLKEIHFRTVPIQPTTDVMSTEAKNKHFITPLQIKYDCKVPLLVFVPPLIVIEAYVDQTVEFFINIYNDANIMGFANYKLIPQTRNGYVTMDENNIKFFIKANESIKQKAVVKFLKTGEVTLHGLINTVGRLVPGKFNITSDVKPPEIKFSPRKLLWEHKTLQKYSIKFFIDNICPTKVRFTLVLKGNTHLYCQPMGGILSPYQSVLIMFYSKIYDPGTYRNTLIIKVVHGLTYEIPITTKAEGFPIVFNPVLKHNFNLGTKFISRPPPYETPVYLSNEGHKPYKLTFIKKRKREEVFGKIIGFHFKEKTIILPPKSKHINYLLVLGEEVGKVFTEFTIDITYDQNQLKNLFKFTTFAEFIKPMVVWMQDIIYFRIENNDNTANDCSQKCSLKNLTPLPVKVNLFAEGSFLLFDNKCFKFGKFMTIVLRKYQERELNVIFEENNATKNNSFVYDKAVQINGKIICRIDGVPYKSLNLMALLIFPKLDVEFKYHIFYTNNLPLCSYYRLYNTGSLLTSFELTLIDEIKYNQDFTLTEKMLDTESLSTMVDNERNLNLLTTPLYFVEPICDYDSEAGESNSNNEVIVTKPEEKKKKKKKKKKDKDKSGTKSGDNKKNEKGAKDSDKLDINDKKSELDIEIPEIDLQLPIVTIEEVLNSLECLWVQKRRKSNQSKSKNVKFPQFKRNLQIVQDTSGRVHQNVSTGFIKGNDSLYLEFYYEESDPFISTNTLQTDYKISSVGGNGVNFSIFVFNFRGRVELDPTEYDLGAKPWYKVYRRNLDILNANTIEFRVKLLSDPYVNEALKFVDGYIKIISDQNIRMNGDELVKVDFTSCMGLSYYYKKYIGVQVNFGITTTAVQIKGSGQLPMAWVLNAPRYLAMSQSRDIEYLTLQFIYDKEIDEQIVPEQILYEYEIERFKEFLSIFNKSSESIKSANRIKASFHHKGKGNEKHHTKEIYTSTSSESEIDVNKPTIPFVVNSPEKTLEALFNSSTEFEIKILNEYAHPEVMPIVVNTHLSSTNNVPIPKKHKPHSIRYAYGSDGQIIQKRKRTERKYKAKLIQEYDDSIEDFIVLDYPKEYPNIFQIEKMYDALNFKLYLNTFKEVSDAFHILCDKYIKIPSAPNASTKVKKPVVHKIFTVQPLPYQVTTYILTMDDMKMNTCHCFEIQLLVSIQEDIILSARTLVPIPGFRAIFEFEESVPKVSIYQSFPQYSMENSYYNLSERRNMSNPNCESCVKQKTTGKYSSCDVKVCHAHSYDIDLNMIHMRVLDQRARSAIKNYYTRLNQSFKDHKNPFILTELFQNDNTNCKKNLLIKLHIQFTPTKPYYYDGQKFEDFLYIDIHMGPTIPIYMKGIISKDDNI